jgi:diguanylate cyclase (GGDEF)-like protein
VPPAALDTSPPQGLEVWAPVSTPIYLLAMITACVVAAVVTHHRLRRRTATPTLTPPQLAGAAQRDLLTGCGDRAAFHEAMAAAGRHRPIAVILINLDGSRAILARLGDRAFDQLLVLIAGRLHHRVTAAGGALFRLRRDEFAAIIDNETTISGLAARLLGAVAEPTDIHVHGDPQTVTVTAGAGVTVFGPGVAGDARRALIQADSALRSAKRTAPGRIAVFGPAIRRQRPGREQPPQAPGADDGETTP